jgi:hypothetical protein
VRNENEKRIGIATEDAKIEIPPFDVVCNFFGFECKEEFNDYWKCEGDDEADLEVAEVA